MGNRAYDNADRAGLFDRDDDVDKKPPGWHVALEVTHNYFGKVYFDNFWDTSKCRWAANRCSYVRVARGQRRSAS